MWGARRPLGVVAALACALVLPVSAAARTPSTCAHASAAPARISTAVAGGALRCLLNAERRRHGLRPVRPSAALRRAAFGHAADMAIHDYFDHVSRHGATFLRRVRGAGYLARARAFSVGEAIAYGVGTAGSPIAILHALLRSPPHRAILLDRAYRDVGIGVAHGAPTGRTGPGALTVTLDFGRVAR